MTIEIRITERKAIAPEGAAIVCGNSGYKIAFAFDGEWAQYAVKTARFIYFKGSEQRYEEVVFTGNQVEVPVFYNINRVKVGVYAGNLRTTTPAEITCMGSILCQDPVHEVPEEDVYRQILGMLEADTIKGPQGEPGEKGEKGDKGDSGEAGYTPVKGKDYFTDADKEEIAGMAADMVEIPDSVKFLEVETEIFSGVTIKDTGSGTSVDAPDMTVDQFQAGQVIVGYVDGVRYEGPLLSGQLSGGEAILVAGSVYSDDFPFAIMITKDLSRIVFFDEPEHEVRICVYEKKLVGDVVGAPVDIPEMGGADWNASEGEPGHVLNRTHWVESGMVEILPEFQPTFYEEEGWFAHATVPVLEVGKTYTVVWNGVEYNCTAWNAQGVLGDTADVGLGNLDLVSGGDGTGEPFVLGTDPAQGACVFMPFDGSTELTVSIYQNNETIHKLPGKFLPEGVPYVEKGGMVEILPMTELTLNVDNFPINTKIEGVEVGKSYVVNYNGTEYTCVGQDVAVMPGAVALGDMSGFSGEPGTGEPFLIMILPDEMFEQMGVGGQVITIDGDETLSISLSAVDETLHKVDPRLLPDDLVKDILIVNVATLDADFNPATASHTGSDLKTACLFGKKAALFACDGKTLPLITVSDTEVTAEFGNIYFSNGSLLRDYVVIDVDGNISTYEMGETVTI